MNDSIKIYLVILIFMILSLIMIYRTWLMSKGDKCPKCKTRAHHKTLGVGPDVISFECVVCGHKWSEFHD